MAAAQHKLDRSGFSDAAGAPPAGSETLARFRLLEKDQLRVGARDPARGSDPAARIGQALKWQQP